jgi:hypothetical protein
MATVCNYNLRHTPNVWHHHSLIQITCTACTDHMALSLSSCQLFSITTIVHRQDVLPLAYKFSKLLAQHHHFISPSTN